MKTKIYIDGQSGTTGLEIYDRIMGREDLDLLRIDEDKRHDLTERKKFLNAADLVFLCLPDKGAVEAVSLIDDPDVKVIDASTAHRTEEGWTYGFPELAPGQREKIRESKRVANPGCHATGFLSVTAPLVRMGILPRDYPVSFFSLTGYSGGGKKMIRDYETVPMREELQSPGIYGLALRHKHLPEMEKYSGLDHPPVFLPVVSSYYRGMAGTLTLENRLLVGHPGAEEIRERMADYYKDEPLIHVLPFGGEVKTLYASSLAGKDSLSIYVGGNMDQTFLTALFDNLGKGASGAAVQNMNIMLGLPEETGLNG